MKGESKDCECDVTCQHVLCDDADRVPDSEIPNPGPGSLPLNPDLTAQ